MSQRDVEDDRQPDIGDPALPVEQAGDEARGHAHQHDRQAEPEHQRRRVIARGAGHRQHVVERHGDVGDHDLPGGLGEGLARQMCTSPPSAPPRFPAGPARAIRATSSRRPTAAECRPPAAIPTIGNSSTATPANTMRSTVAATMPTRIARARCACGKPAAASPMTTALSPASTRSIMITCRKAAIAACEKSSFMGPRLASAARFDTRAVAPKYPAPGGFSDPSGVSRPAARPCAFEAFPVGPGVTRDRGGRDPQPTTCKTSRTR